MPTKSPIRISFAALAILLVMAVGTMAAEPTALSCKIAAKGKDFSGQNLTDHNFRAEPPGALVGANFKNAVLNGAVFAGQNLTGASFEGADLGPSEKGPVDFTSTRLDGTCFIGAVMNQTDFTFAKFICADFSATSLLKAEFGPLQDIAAGKGCRTRFNGATIDVGAIAPENWGKTDFSNAVFQGVSPASFNLRGQDITGAILVGTTFPNIDMTGANLTAVDLSHATLTGSHLTNAAMNATTLVNAKLDFVDLTCARFYFNKGDSSDINGKLCKDTPATTDPTGPADLTQANLRHANLTNVTLDNAALNGANLTSAVFRHATLRGASLQAKGSINQATIQATSFSGAVFDNARLNNVQFNNVHLVDARFEGKTTLEGTSFAGSIMPGVSFNGAVLESVTFHSTILQSADFSDTTLKTVPDGGGSGVDFSCSQLGGSSFKNAVVTAASFALAVMPGVKDCCPAKDGFQWCGTVDSTGLAYGPVTYPVLNSAVTCPNGDIAACKGSQWRLSANWSTDACNPNQVEQTLWRKPPCGSSPGNIVHFKDPNLKRCILEALPGDPSEITVQTAAEVDRVICPARGIADLTGLDKFTALVELDLTANKITGFALGLEKLQQLRLADNQLTLLDLTKMSNLVWLVAAGNSLKSVQGLGTLYLQVVDLSGNQLTDLDLAVQGDLVSANLSGNRLTDVLDTSNRDLGRLEDLLYLDLSHNALTTIGSAKSIAYGETANPNGALTALFLQCNPTFECDKLDLNGGFQAYRTSHCADFNSQDNQWVPRQHPQCLTGGSQEK